MPHASLNLYVIFIGLGVVILPFFVVASMMKIGNFANDGRKIGITMSGAPQSLSSHDSTPSSSSSAAARSGTQGQGRFGRSLFYSDFAYDDTEQEDEGEAEEDEDELYNIYANVGGLTKPSTTTVNNKEKRRAARQSLFGRIWSHGPPVAPMLHIIAAFCFLVPRLLMEAQLIKFGFLPKGQCPYLSIMISISSMRISCLRLEISMNCLWRAPHLAPSPSIYPEVHISMRTSQSVVALLARKSR